MLLFYHKRIARNYALLKKTGVKFISISDLLSKPVKHASPKGKHLTQLPYSARNGCLNSYRNLHRAKLHRRVQQSPNSLSHAVKSGALHEREQERCVADDLNFSLSFVRNDSTILSIYWCNTIVVLFYKLAT